MRTSAICRRDDAGFAAGFTLVELTVVLALAALLAGLALPNMARLYDAFAWRAERDDIVAQFANLGRRALTSGRAYVIMAPDAADAARYADYAPYPLSLPPGWRLQVPAPVLVRANGVCLGGELRVTHETGAVIELTLAPPFCRVAAD